MDVRSADGPAGCQNAETNERLGAIKRHRQRAGGRKKRKVERHSREGTAFTLEGLSGR